MVPTPRTLEGTQSGGYDRRTRAAWAYVIHVTCDNLDPARGHDHFRQGDDPLWYLI